MPDGRPRRLIYNSDSTNMLMGGGPISPSDLTRRVDEICRRCVTTLFLSPNAGMKMICPTRVSEMLTPESVRDPVLDRSPPDLSPEVLNKGWRERLVRDRLIHSQVARNIRSLLRAGCDPLELMIKRAKDRGLETFVSFRLNEVHNVEQPDSPIVSRFWREHPGWRLGRPGDPLPELHREIIGPRVNPIVQYWLPGALNFAVDGVRRHRLAQLREICQKYPVDGLDLDFQRFPAYFPLGEEERYRDVMTGWIEQVKLMVEEIAQRRGRRILLSARITARPEQNEGLGLDPVTWVHEGLIDFLTVSHYLRNDFPLPIGEYRRTVPKETPLYASIEYERDPERYRCIARRLWRDGVDGIMVFNFFAAREEGREPRFDLLCEIGSPDLPDPQREE